MKEGPDIARIAALIADPARANMLAALMTGKALTASELAAEAGITRQTASSHLRQLEDGNFITTRPQGRHRYVTLANEDIAKTLEALMGLAATTGQLRTQPGPKDPELRLGRVCYNHLAGETGVQMFRALKRDGAFEFTENGLTLSNAGADQVHGFGINLAALAKSRAPLCRECLDWSARESHLAGKLGRAMLDRIEALNWAQRHADSRIVQFSKTGRAAFDAAFPKLS